MSDSHVDEGEHPAAGGIAGGLKHLTGKQKIIGAVILLVVLLGVMRAKRAGTASPAAAITPATYQPEQPSYTYRPPGNGSGATVPELIPAIVPQPTPQPVIPMPTVNLPTPSMESPIGGNNGKAPVTSDTGARQPNIIVPVAPQAAATVSPDNQTLFLTHLAAGKNPDGSTATSGNIAWASAQLEATPNQALFLTHLAAGKNPDGSAASAGNISWAAAQLATRQQNEKAAADQAAADAAAQAERARQYAAENALAVARRAEDARLAAAAEARIRAEQQTAAAQAQAAAAKAAEDQAMAGARAREAAANAAYAANQNAANLKAAQDAATYHPVVINDAQQAIILANLGTDDAQARIRRIMQPGYVIQV